MTYVVTERCIRCKYTDCIETCPVDCFHEGPNMLVINPEECIDCNLCVAACPVDAIYPDFDLPESQKEFLTLNAKLSSKWPQITQKIDSPKDADQWKDVMDKRHLLEVDSGENTN